MNKYRGIVAILVACLTSGTLYAQQQQSPPPPQPQQPGIQQGTQQGTQQGAPENDPHLAEEQAAQRQALGFLGYLDQGRFAESYAYTGMLIRDQVDQNAFTDKVQKARAGTGALLSRDLIDSAYTDTVPGAPEGQYVVLHYHVSFANRPSAVETVTLDFARNYWRLAGYYIKAEPTTPAANGPQ
jgi:hypothetical protein